jgi:cytochrome c peroxidase
MRTHCSVLLSATVALSGCMLGHESSDGPEDDEVQGPVGVVRAAVEDEIDEDEDVDDFRSRRTDNRDLQRRKKKCEKDPRVALGLVSQNVCVGANLFFREPFGGNGRACGTCHAARFNFTIGPAFIDSLEDDDPLFVAENKPALAGLEKPELMRDFGLILENVDGAENPTVKFVMRSVPHTFSLSKSIVPGPIVNPDGTAADGTTQPPNERVGWGGDGAPSPGGLKQFQVGAIFQHYTKSLARVSGVDFKPATDEQLSRIDDFLRVIGRTEDISLTTISFSDSGAEAGRNTFLAPTSRCNGCHTNASANVAAGFNRNFDTGVETVRVSDLNAMGIPHDGGFGGAAPGAPFNHDADGNGINDSFGKGTFSTPPLIEAADTGPFFHTNAFENIEQAIAFYTTSAFANSAAGGGNAIPLSPTEVQNVGKFLRALNAAFNAQLAVYRIQSTITVVTEYKNRFKGVQKGMLETAQSEVRDALRVLSEVGIYSAVRSQLQAADVSLGKAISQSAHKKRKDDAVDALGYTQSANTGLGTNIVFNNLGQGSLMF